MELRYWCCGALRLAAAREVGQRRTSSSRVATSAGRRDLFKACFRECGVKKRELLDGVVGGGWEEKVVWCW